MPEERIKKIYRNALFFTSDKRKAEELTYFIINSFQDYCVKMHDKAYWIECEISLKNAINSGTL